MTTPVTFSPAIPQHIIDWIKTDPYLLRNMPFFAWHRPTDRANNSFNEYPTRTLAAPNPDMIYIGCINNRWQRLEAAADEAI